MTDKKSSDSRRKLLKSIAAGSGAVAIGQSVPESWKKPVIDAVTLPVHAATSPSCDLQLDGCMVTCNSGEGLLYGVYFDYKMYTLEIQDGCPRVADLKRFCCEYDPSLLELAPGANQLLTACNQYTYELAPTYASVSVTLPKQSAPYALGEWNCGEPGSVRTPGGVFESTMQIEGITVNVRTEISVASGVTLSSLLVTPL